MRDISIKILLLTLGILLALVVAELYIRKFNPQKTYSEQKTSYNFPLCLENGTYFWFQFKQNQQCILKSNYNAFPDSVLTINSLRLRNQEITIKKPQNTKRVLFIGDSFVMGLGVDEKSSFPRVTEKLLTQDLKTKFQSINSGLLGTDVSYYYLYLKNEGLHLDPDVIVVGFFIGNDIVDTEFENKWENIDSEGLPQKIISDIAELDANGRIKNKNIPFEYKYPILRDSHLFLLLADHFFIKSKPVSKNFLSSICLFRNTCTDIMKRKENIKKIFLAIKKLTNQDGKKLLILLIPVEHQVNEFSRYKYNISVPLTPTEKYFPQKEFSTFFAKNNIDYIDLLPIFESFKNAKLYFEHDVHWNEYGHKIAAGTVNIKLKEYFLENKLSTNSSTIRN